MTDGWIRLLYHLNYGPKTAVYDTAKRPFGALLGEPATSPTRCVHQG